MQKPWSQTYNALREYLNSVPVIESHEHFFAGTDTAPGDALSLAVGSYSASDLSSVSRKLSTEIFEIVLNKEKPFDERFECFEKAYEKSRYTAYNQSVFRGLKECWGVDQINKESLLALQERMPERNNEFYERMLDKYKIRAKIIDTCDDAKINTFAKINGKLEGYSSDCRFAFSLPPYHIWDQPAIPKMLKEQTGLEVRDLDELMVAFETHLKACIEAGIVCFKDQSAYNRIIRYDVVPREEADNLFSRMLVGGKEKLNNTESETLSNWLMREYMKLAQKYNLPVQFHTGHMAGLYNEITKTNASHLTSLLADFSDVHFDLFHGNWPFMDEYLFLGKNYPNVSLDLCWVQAIDPIYCVELVKRAIMTVPHNKVIAFGGDDSVIEHIIGYLCLARDNVACALSDLIESNWITMQDAKAIACDWFYNNPNSIFKLGFEPIKP